MNKSVYLAGPITGLATEIVKEWRDKATGELAKVGIVGLCPVDVQAQAADIKRAAIMQDKFDVIHCSGVLMNLTNAVKASIGTMVELGWADALGKPVVVVMDKGNPHDHGFVNTLAFQVVDNLDEGIRLITQLVERQ